MIEKKEASVDPPPRKPLDIGNSKYAAKYKKTVRENLRAGPTSQWQ